MNFLTEMSLEDKLNTLVEGDIWEHSSTGNLYSIKAIAKNVNIINQYWISYKAEKTGIVWGREAVEFFEEVLVDGYMVPRFRPYRGRK